MYTKEEQDYIDLIRQHDPTFQLSKSEALTYAAEMGASDSWRGLKQMGANFFGFEDTVEELKEKDRKLQAILDNEEYGGAATGTFLTSAVIADPIGYIPIVGTAKKAKNIYQLGKYGAMAGGFHAGIGYVSEDAPGLIGEKQTRLENALIGVGAGSALGIVGGAAVNAVSKARGKGPIYGDLAKQTDELDAPKVKVQTDKDPETNKVIEKVVEENSKEGAEKVKLKDSAIQFYQEIAGNRMKDVVFNNGGTSLVGFFSGISGYNAVNDPEATEQEKLGAMLLAGLAGAAGTKFISRVKIGDEAVGEKMARLFIDDYGLTDEYKLIRRELNVNKNQIANKFLGLAKETSEKLSMDERKLLYNFMTGDLDSVDDLVEGGLKINDEARELIKEMGQKYIDFELVSAKTIQKNAETYLHRSYLRSSRDPKFAKTATALRDISIMGDELRPRGVTKTINKATWTKKKKEYMAQGYELFGKPGKTKSGKPSKKVTIRRDYTKEERIAKGEIEDAAFAIAETGRLMSNDIATAEFYRKIAKNKNFTSDELQEGFELVPNTLIKGTKKKAYGELAGKYVHSDVLNDITRMYDINTGDTMQNVVKQFGKAQAIWKKSKTAWNPAVHVNNTVSNFILLDFADAKVETLVKATKQMRLGDKSDVYKLAKEQGVFDVDVVTRELNETGGIISKELEKIADVDKVDDMVNYSMSLWKKLKLAKKATLGKLEDAYQYEDQVFRMAVFMDRLDKGQDVTKAAMEARKWFIDYDINAPAINAMRRTVTPFLSYTYRVIPLLAETAVLRPHKYAKWAAIGYGLNEVGKQIGGGNEELERVTMRDELTKKVWGVPYAPPKLIRLPFDSNAGDSQYIDVSRFIPGGDIFEQREAEGFKLPAVPSPFQPGGLLVDIPLLLGTRENPFSGQEIEGLGVGKDGQALAKAIIENLTPNVPGIPGSYATKKIQKAYRVDKDLPYYSIPGSQYSADYTVFEAIAYGLGIKLRPQNVDVNKRLKRIEFNRNLQAIDKQVSSIQNKFRKGEYNSVKERDDKIKELELQKIKLLGEWSLYQRQVDEAQAKDIVKSREPKVTGGLVEGPDVPTTEENPADRTDPFTGMSYTDQMNRLGFKDGGFAQSLLSYIAEKREFEDGGFLKEYAEDVAWQESRGRGDNIVQDKGGPARGKYQVEGSQGSKRNETILNRAHNFYEKYPDAPKTKEIKYVLEQRGKDLDFSSLSGETQDALFFMDAERGTLPLEDLYEGELDNREAWIQHWNQDPNIDKPEVRKRREEDWDRAQQEKVIELQKQLGN